MIKIKEIEVNEKGLNKHIKANIFPDDKMRSLGFTDYAKDSWDLCKTVSKDITFNLSIDKKTSQIEIDVLDENFLQPYDYQDMIISGNYNKFCENIHYKVQNIMKELLAIGVIEGYKLGDYI